MMRDLFSDLPLRECDGNYVTRTVRRWIETDPAVDEQCRDLAREWLKNQTASRAVDGVRLDALDPASLADQLRVLVVTAAISVERPGFLPDLFTVDARGRRLVGTRQRVSGKPRRTKPEARKVLNLPLPHVGRGCFGWVLHSYSSGLNPTQPFLMVAPA
jgi:hypothetical protein